MTAFRTGLYSESSRWGDVKLPAPRISSFGFTDWQTNTGFIVNTFLPAQRTAFLTDAPDFGLLVTPTVNALNQGPEVTLTVPGGTSQPFSGGLAPLNSVLTISAPGKTIYYNLLFIDPKTVSAGANSTAASTKAFTLNNSFISVNGSDIEINSRTFSGSVWSGLSRIDFEIQ